MFFFHVRFYDNYVDTYKVIFTESYFAYIDENKKCTEEKIIKNK